MTNEHRYLLEKGSKKYICPNCSKNTFVRYIDKQTGDYLPEYYGRCDRESKCSYFLNPYLDGYAKAINEQEQGNCSEFANNWKPQSKTIKPQPTNENVFIPFDIFKNTLQTERYENNVFIQNLLKRIVFPFEAKDVEKVISLYYLGTISKGYRFGANTFPFIDIKGNIRAIQVKQFNEANHTTSTDFIHSIIEKHCIQNNKPLPEWLEMYIKNDKKVSCLFGEHLLSKYPRNPVALVEAPKTAVYCSLYFGLPELPENLIWLAVYNKSSFAFDKMKVLQGRDVYTFPDLSKDGNTFNEWKQKSKDIENKLKETKFIFSDLLEQIAPETDKQNGYDIADYLIQHDWRLFRKKNIKEQPELIPVENSNCEKCEKCEPPKNTFFLHDEALPIIELNIEQIELPEKEIADLKNYFDNKILPIEPIKLNQCSTIVDINLFIESHFTALQYNKGKQIAIPYFNRLKELRNILN